MTAPAALSTLVDLKIISKPRSFGKEASNWSEWKWAFENYMACVEPRFVPELEAAAASPDSLALDDMGNETQKRSYMLFAVLAGLLEAKSQQIAKNMQDRNGYELWRRLHQEFEPDLGARRLALLDVVTSAAELQVREADFSEGLLAC